MSSPIHLNDDTDPKVIYAPPRARTRILSAMEPRSRKRGKATAEIRSGKSKPKFSGDRAMLTLQRQLALNPDLIPEPSSNGVAVIGPLLIRLCTVTALAAFVAWGLVSYSPVKKTAAIVSADTSAPAIASGHAKAVDVQSLQLRPTLSQATEVPAPVAKSRPVVVATADAEAVMPVAVTAPKPAEAVVTTPAPSEHASVRRPLRLDSEEIAILVKRGNDLLADGDIAAARLLLRRAAEAGSADGALALGTTFDPIALQRLGAIGAVADLAKARQWYQRAAELGSSAASQQLAGLTDAR